MEIVLLKTYHWKIFISASRFWGPRRVVELDRIEGERLGINIWGGTLDMENNTSSDFVTGIFIKSIVPNSLADKTGQFRDWDRILEVKSNILNNIYLLQMFQ